MCYAALRNQLQQVIAMPRFTSRPNAVKKLQRIRREIEELLDSAPMVWGAEGQRCVEETARNALDELYTSMLTVYALSLNEYERLKYHANRSTPRNESESATHNANSAPSAGGNRGSVLEFRPRGQRNTEGR